jgi:prophage regulatory protein
VPEKLMRLREVLDQTGLARSTARRMIQQGTFPAPIHINGARLARWSSSAVDSWVAEQIAQKDNHNG